LTTDIERERRGIVGKARSYAAWRGILRTANENAVDERRAAVRRISHGNAVE
jgi:hypothetical protein